MQHKAGNLWTDSRADVRLFTGNRTVRADGCLVMGRGAALEAQRLFPGCNRVFGDLVRQHRQHAGPVPYGVLLHPTLREPHRLGVLQVKYRWDEMADLELIATSCGMLKVLADREPGTLWAVNYPGIGYGGLRRELVEPLVVTLPDNVEVWQFGKRS